MQFQLPSDIVQRFNPHKNMTEFLRMGTATLQRYEWEPLPLTTMQTVEKFLTDIAGMIKVEQAQYDVDIILQNQVYDHPGMQYVCSYTFPDEISRNKWALPEEVMLYQEMDFQYSTHIKETNSNFLEYEDIKDIWKALPTGNTRIYFVNKYKLLNLYSVDEIYFGDLQAYGLMPKIIKYSLYYMLSKAPIPEETYSEWPMYLQFLIDIGYIHFTHPECI